MGPRWKSKAAMRKALEDPISILYEKMRAWKDAPLKAVLVDKGSIVELTAEKSCILDRASFGLPIIDTPYDDQGCTTEQEKGEAGLRILQLSLEETYYLSDELGCLDIYQRNLDGYAKLTGESAWMVMQTLNDHFVEHYKAYSHLRLKGWVVLSGPQYGADFMAYRHHPALVHSEYAVLVMLEGASPLQISRWTEVQRMNRLCATVAKTLLLLYITPKGNTSLSSPKCLDDYTVNEVEVKRWIAEKHRDNQSIQ